MRLHPFLLRSLPLLVRLFKTYILLVLAAFMAVFAVHHISHEGIEENVRRSLATIQDEGVYPRLLGCELLRIDNFTDALMLNMAYCADSDKPLDAALTNTFFTDDDMDVFSRTAELVRGDTLQGFLLPYPRYWHGHQVVLRPLLVVMDYTTLLFVNKYLFYFLLLLCLYVVYRRLSLLVAVAMLGALLLVGLPAIPMCIQFSTTFYIAMLSVLAVLLWPGLTRERGDAYITFFTIGALTAFFDFLTTPQVTLGFPLVVCLLLRKPWRTVRDVVLFLLSWFSGYASLWVSKCLLAQLLTTHDVIGNFLQLVRVRTIAGTGTLVPFLSDRWGEERAFQLISLLCVLIALFLLLVIYAWHRLSRNPQVRRQRWLLVIALIPPVSYVLTLQHAVIHYWFVWRALSVTFLCVFLFAYFITHSSHEQDRRTHSLL